MIYIALMFFIILSIIMILIVLSYRRQVKQICRQLEFVLEYESNLVVSKTSGSKLLCRLVEKINKLITNHKEERNVFKTKEKMISDIYTNLSHDIRTPLTSLDGYVQLLSESENEEDKNRYLKVVRERIKCLKEMLEELFTFTKLKNEEWKIELERISISSILKETLFSYYDDWQNNNVNPIIDIPDEIIYIIGNEQALKRSLQNIFKNAIEHGQNQIFINMKKEDKLVYIKIGNELRDEFTVEPNKVFDRFYRADVSRSKNSTGLGLPISKEFVERMNGSIYATIEEKKFFITMSFKTV